MTVTNAHEGIDYALERLCEMVEVDPKNVSWDAATETVDGDVQAVIGNILTAAFGENWQDRLGPPAPSPDGEVSKLIAKLENDGTSWAQPMFDAAASALRSLQAENARLAAQAARAEAAEARASLLDDRLEDKQREVDCGITFSETLKWRAEAAEARAERLAGALKPFAAKAAQYDNPRWNPPDDLEYQHNFRVGDFRCARAALSDTRDKEGGALFRPDVSDEEMDIAGKALADYSNGVIAPNAARNIAYQMLVALRRASFEKERAHD